MPDEQKVSAGYSQDRVGFFTDAVFAIAMTLLVLEIPKPEAAPEFDADEVGRAEAAGNLLRFLYDQIPTLSSYLLAFWILWIVWRKHHQLLDRTTRMTPGLIRLHFPLLLLAGFVPYVSTVYDHNANNPAAAGLFTVVVAALLLVRSAVQTRALTDGVLRADVDREAYRKEVRRSWIVGGYFAATLALCWFTPWVILAWFGATLLGSILSPRTR